MSIEKIVSWFERATPEPTATNFNVQLGCHLEELAEMLRTLKGDDEYSHLQVGILTQTISNYADSLKSGNLSVALPKENRVEFLDGVLDQIVTVTGLAVYQQMQVVDGLNEVADSNESKFEDGKPLRDENQKIIKGKDYFKPQLDRFV